LTKEARAAVSTRRKEARAKFRNDLHNAWKTMDAAAENIAANNNKSVRRVQLDLHMGRALSRIKRSKVSDWNAFCWKRHQVDEKSRGTGKDLLPALVQDLSKEYATAPQAEKDAITEEYKQYKATKSIGFRVSTKSKVSDVASTMKLVEHELANLRSRTGAESILYTTRGSTDLPINGIAFATPGVGDFIPTAMGIDHQDLISKMEGFAVQGIKGAAKNHSQRVSALRSDIRLEIQQQLRAITGDPGAEMAWKHYWRLVVKAYKVRVAGWPDNIPFANLSTVSSALPDLESLLRKWKLGTIHWEKINDEELTRLTIERDEQLETGVIEEPRRRPRSDKGKKRVRGSTRGASAAQEHNRNRNTVQYKSAETIFSDGEDEDRAGSMAPAPHRTDTTNSPATPAASATPPPFASPTPQAGTSASFNPGFLMSPGINTQTPLSAPSTSAHGQDTIQPFGSLGNLMNPSVQDYGNFFNAQQDALQPSNNDFNIENFLNFDCDRALEDINARYGTNNWSV
ncbi:hypothetical protein BJ138DRAFT_1018526, partial [Hygrophoropsis aurantiaca]